MRFPGPALLVALLLSLPASAQNQVAFGGLKADPTKPVEVTADSLAVNQSDGTAVFTGNVLVIQGDMRLKAATVAVTYKPDDRKKIESLAASGGVTLSAGPDAAESRDAVYVIDSGQVVMTGNVLLTQGAGIISGQKLTVDLKSGTGSMDGRVKTVLTPGGN